MPPRSGGKCRREAWIGQLVADPAPFAGGGHQPAAAQTGEMVRDVGLGEPELLGELGGVARSVEQQDQELPAGLVGQCGADTSQGVEINRGREHGIIVQL